ncbi:RIO1-domain-containing protein [Thelephora terrestris]|uniref:Serine/threonine-protein kinase RIO2 n=1 Tax=Thelephora terrestris TaxID=56493 RepID=A0A9P6H4M4_9AGAM|nr:RIO1-domain-containing protein [Thelephora terrestris]
MKLDATDLRYITSDEFRVLTAVEMGSKNHEIVPTALIVQISGLRNGGLAKRNLVARVRNAKYDGYRLTYGGYDYLAMRTLSKRGTVHSVGNQIGVGKESDIYIVADSEANEMVLKLHRLGRVSFRAIKEKRDYMGKRKSASWMYMSRLAAQKEWAFMKVLHEHGFPVPRPIDQSRHTLLMEFIDAYPLRQISEVPSPGKLYSTLMDLIIRFAKSGLIHGDFNEFNILIRRATGEPVVIDFPQMVSTSHTNAEWYFNRDVECIRTFFRRRFRYESNLYPRFRSTINRKDGEGGAKEGDDDEDFRLDVVVAASGFKHSEQQVLEEYMGAVGEDEDRGFSHSEEEEDGEDLSNDEESIASERDAEKERGEAEHDGSAEDHDLDATARGSNLDHGGQEETAITRTSPENEPGRENDRSSTGSGVPSVPRSVSVETGQRNLKISERDAPEKGERDRGSLSLGAPAYGVGVEHPLDRGSKVKGANLASDQDSGSDSDGDDEVTEGPQVTSSRIKERVATEIVKDKNRQRKYHSKKSAQRSKGGRVKGSKAKNSAKEQVASAGWF